jgi:hypothetical protein
LLPLAYGSALAFCVQNRPKPWYPLLNNEKEANNDNDAKGQGVGCHCLYLTKKPPSYGWEALVSWLLLRLLLPNRECPAKNDEDQNNDNEKQVVARVHVCLLRFLILFLQP